MAIEGKTIKLDWHPYPEVEPPKEFGNYYITILWGDGKTKYVREATYDISEWDGKTCKRWTSGDGILEKDYTGYVIAWAEKPIFEPYEGDGFHLDGN